MSGPHLSWDELRDLRFTPLTRTDSDERDGLYRYTDPYGRVVVLDTQRSTLCPCDTCLQIRRAYGA